MFQKVWGIAEQMDWDRRFPRFFWRWLLRWCDRRAGYGIAGGVGPDGLGVSADTGCEGQGPTQGGYWAEGHAPDSATPS